MMRRTSPTWCPEFPIQPQTTYWLLVVNKGALPIEPLHNMCSYVPYKEPVSQKGVNFAASALPPAAPPLSRLHLGC